MNSRMVLSFNSLVGLCGSDSPFAVLLVRVFHFLRHERFLPKLGRSGYPRFCIPTPSGLLGEMT
jgi:hypothetical protein